MTKRLSFEQRLQYAIPSSNKGIFYATAEIQRLIEENPVGFYQYTKLSAHLEKEYKCGQSGVDVFDRIAGTGLSGLLNRERTR
jgi:hypothetical protein